MEMRFNNWAGIEQVKEVSVLVLRLDSNIQNY